MRIFEFLRKAFAPGKLWSMAIYAQDESFALEKLPLPLRIFNSKKLRLDRDDPHTQADPFLYVWGERLYLFYEKVVPGGHGAIAAYSTSDLQEFTSHGVILQEEHHLSFPFVFEYANRLYILPEAARSGEIALYEFERVPDKIIKKRVLRQGVYVDSFLICWEGIWYLFTTTADGVLELFFSSDLLQGEFKLHPSSPITRDLRYSRSGGGPIVIKNKLMRVAQDCSDEYGGNIGFIEIVELSPTTYSEKVIRDKYFSRSDSWNILGAHHISATNFCKKTVVATDGRHEDYLINRLLLRFL